MSKSLRAALLLLGSVLLVLLALWVLPARLGGRDVELPAARLVVPQAARAAAQGFRRASPNDQLSFPKDYGPHPDYQTEWWYYTGSLHTLDGRRFGYQLTFFRRALIPPQERVARASAWATDQVYLAHFALSDITGQGFHAYEELARGAVGLAGAQAQPFQVWLYDWQVEETSAGVYHLAAARDGFTIDVSLVDSKGPILQGIDGYSQKGPETGNASHYFAQTRLETQGEVVVQGQRFSVSGSSWMDHEFSTSALSEGQVGWDWFSLQLEDGSELMVYQIRRADGTIDAFSSGTIIDPSGATMHLARQDFEIEVLGEWESPHSGATYPSGWRLKIPQLSLELEIQPLQKDQELNLSYTYWEGAVRVNGQMGETPANGYGYVELTGYAGTMAGEF